MKMDISRINFLIEEAKNELRHNGYSEDFANMCKIIIETKDPVANYLFAREVNTNLPKVHGSIVNNYGTDELIFKFATEVSGASIEDAKNALKRIKSYRFLKKLEYETTPINEL